MLCTVEAECLCLLKNGWYKFSGSARDWFRWSSSVVSVVLRVWNGCYKKQKCLCSLKKKKLTKPSHLCIAFAATNARISHMQTACLDTAWVDALYNFPRHFCCCVQACRMWQFLLSMQGYFFASFSLSAALFVYQVFRMCVWVCCSVFCEKFVWASSVQMSCNFFRAIDNLSRCLPPLSEQAIDNWTVRPVGSAIASWCWIRLFFCPWLCKVYKHALLQVLQRNVARKEQRCVPLYSPDRKSVV